MARNISYSRSKTFEKVEYKHDRIAIDAGNSASDTPSTRDEIESVECKLAMLFETKL